MTVLFEKFRIIEKLKESVSSSVYLARHLFLDKPIILKTLNTENLDDPAMQERFRSEAKILARLDHPHIIRVLDFGIWEQTYYISFEYFDSINLRAYLQKTGRPPEETDSIIAQIASALEYAHSNEIIHQDLKPENILIDDRGTVKIADFGLALVRTETSSTPGAPVTGTPAYMSPEQIRGEPLSHKSDLFSLGIIIHELYTGINPFLGKTAPETLNAILRCNPKQIAESASGLPDKARECITRLLVGNPGKRPDSAAFVRQRFPSPEPEETRLQDITNPPVRHLHLKTWITVGAAAALIYFLVAVTPGFLSDRNGTEQEIAGKEQSEHSLSPVTEQPDIGIEAGRKPEKASSEPDHAAERQPSSAAGALSAKQPPGGLMVECLPWAYISVDSLNFDSTPFAKPVEVNAGRHKLYLRHPKYPTYSRPIEIRSGEILHISVNMDTLFGFLFCELHPWGEVYIDNTYLAQTPMEEAQPLLPGRYRLTLRNPQTTDHETDIHIKQGDTLIFRYNFNRGSESGTREHL